MLAIGLVVAVPVTLIVRGDSGTSESALDAIELPELGATKFNRELGVKMRLPRGWDSEQKGPIIVMRSADRQARVAVSAPGPAEDAAQLHEQVLSQIKSTYKNSKVVESRGKSQIGGLKAATSAVEADPAKGPDLGILIASAAGKDRAYLVVTYTPLVDPGASTVEAQALLNELKLVG